MNNYKPSYPFNLAAYLLIPTEEIVKGVPVKTFPQVRDGEPIFISFKTFGGTEVEKNGVITVLDTANVETWYRPDIKAGCRIAIALDIPEIYEIIGTPENINMKNQFIKFKVQSIKGGA